MSEHLQNPTNQDEAQDGLTSGPNPQDEKAMLMQRATTLGISFGPNIGVDALRKRVNDALNGVSAKEEKTQESMTSMAPVVRQKTRMEKEQDLREAVVRDAMALVRCKIYNLNPQKRDLRGELITVANKYIGKVQKFVPFGEDSEKGYHLPKVIYDDLVSREFLELRTKEVNGKTQISRRMVPEYNIVVLPQLTREELAELALKQEAAKRLEA